MSLFTTMLGGQNDGELPYQQYSYDRISMTKNGPTRTRREARAARKLSGDELDSVLGIGRVDLSAIISKVKRDSNTNESKTAPNRADKRRWGLRKSAKAGARRRMAHAARRAG